MTAPGIPRIPRPSSLKVGASLYRWAFTVDELLRVAAAPLPLRVFPNRSYHSMRSVYGRLETIPLEWRVSGHFRAIPATLRDVGCPPRVRQRSFQPHRMKSQSIASTLTDLLLYQWGIDDVVIQLREWATNQVHILAPILAAMKAKGTTGGIAIGRARGCQIRLADPRAARVNAVLEREHGHWVVDDKEKSTNGLHLDGVRTARAVLVPGTEIRCGDTTFVAESARFIVLRNAVTRMLGWEPGRRLAIDLALRAIRLAAIRHTALVICGTADGGDLIPIAEELHELTLGDRPFVLCRATDPRGGINAKRFPGGLDALDAARNGTVCIEGPRPPDLKKMLEKQRPPESRTQLMVCQPHRHEFEIFSESPIELPSLSSRQHELDDIIDDYSSKAAVRLKMTTYTVSASERAWIRKDASRSLAEVQRATLRLAALQVGGGTWRGAGRLLGMHHDSLAQWFREHHYSLPKATAKKQ